MPGSFIPPILIGLPLLGAIFVLCTPKGESSLHRGIGLAFASLTFLVSLGLISFFNLRNPNMQMVFDAEWIPGLGAHFKTGVDGFSFTLIILC